MNLKDNNKHTKCMEIVPIDWCKSLLSKDYYYILKFYCYKILGLILQMIGYSFGSLTDREQKKGDGGWMDSVSWNSYWDFT